MLARCAALEALTSHPFDVVVIGGGITGAGCALDAASRGFSVALLEKRDFAAGTSSRSSKLVHGGQTDDARLVLTVLGEAERFGAVCANRLEVNELVYVVKGTRNTETGGD